MISFSDVNAKKAVVFNGKEVFVETKKTPMLLLGRPAVDISNCPDFKFSNKTRLFPSKITNVEQKGDTLLLEFSANGLSAKAEFSENDDGELKVSLSSSEDLAIRLNMPSSRSEHIFGTGESFKAADLKGERFRVFVEEHISVMPIAKKIIRLKLHLNTDKPHAYSKYKNYYVQPTFIASDPKNNKNMTLIASSERIAFFDFKKPDVTSLDFFELPLEITVKFHDSVLDCERYFARKLGMLPKLSEDIYDGMILGIQSGTKVCDDKVQKLISKGAKINGIWAQDWCGEIVTDFGKQVFWNYKHDPSLYPELSEYIKKWREQGIGFYGYINPYLNENGDLFKEAEKNGWLVKKPDGTTYLLSMSTFKFGTVDLTNPEAYSWYKENIKQNMIGFGLAGWMADFGEYLPTDGVLYGGSGYDVHNIYPVLWAKCNREALEETNSLGKVTFFMRSGYLGAAKYNTLMWNGDQHVDFTRDYGLGSAIIAAISLGYSGMGTSHSDVGGYTTIAPLSRTEELYLRWLEMNAFMPFLRSHEGNRPWDSFQFDQSEKAIDGTARFSSIYARLKPYFLDEESYYHETATPIIRSVYSDFEEEEYAKIEDEFFSGRELLVCPIIKEGAVKRSVTLPCDMVHLFTKKLYKKGTHEIDVPMGQPAVFFMPNGAHKELFESIK